MTTNSVEDHYQAGGPLQRVTAALDRISPDGGPLTLEQLNGFDDFHTAGRMATTKIADLLAPTADDVVLDAGAGLGGPARYLADRFGCRVIGVDLTPELVEIGQMINARTGMADRVDLRVGDITKLDLADAEVDQAWTQHVAMNIGDRPGLYRELRRVLRPGGRLAMFDVVDGGGGELLVPVPWATQLEHSHLVTADHMRGVLEDSGFRVDVWEDPTEVMIAGMRAMLSAGPPPGPDGPPLGPPLFIDNIEAKGANYLQNMEEHRTALVLGLVTAV